MGVLQALPFVHRTGHFPPPNGIPGTGAWARTRAKGPELVTSGSYGAPGQSRIVAPRAPPRDVSPLVQKGEGDPVPSPHAHLPDDAGTGAPSDSRFRTAPVGLDDIDRLLEESSLASTPAGAPSVRAWRDDLALVLEALRYARAILAGDVAILRHALGVEGTSQETIVAALPAVLGARPGGDGWSDPAPLDPDVDLDPDVFTRADDLVSVHDEMAGVDLGDPHDVAPVLELIEDTLVAVTAYQAAVELRLQQIRGVILRQYVEGVIPSREPSRERPA